METLQHWRQIKVRLQQRAALIAAVRAYFDRQGFLEIETPVVIAAPAPEEYIEGIPVENGFLRTSPELQMKKLLCADYEKIYQIGPCFRRNEFGARHRPEFTLLEWYETKLDYRQLLEFTAGLLRFAARNVTGSLQFTYQGQAVDLEAPPEIITVREACRQYAGIELERIATEAEFDEIMVSRLEPRLGMGRMTFLIDYPAARAALARRKPGAPEIAERWELYIAGMELANAYGELTDPVEQRQRFLRTQAVRAENHLLSYPFPEDFFAALEAGLPECSGAALGIDRLAMIFTDAADISEVRV
ncbi:MAG: EF-P lysine aminoacylase EpmA [Victivallaceae bacterium]|nr:EF-P lysine aminoacylase EpmA [Victivallaceae bacterium]